MTWDDTPTFAAVLSAMAAAVAAYYSYKQTRSANRAIQIQAFQNVFQEVRQQEKEFYRFLARLDGNEDSGRSFFNTIEYLSFLIDREMLEQEVFKEFYKDALLFWWQLFEKHVAENVRNDPDQYREFKKLVQHLKTSAK